MISSHTLTMESDVGAEGITVKKRREKPSAIAQIVRPVLIGAVCGIALGCLILAGAAAVMTAVSLPDVAVRPIAYAALSLAALCGGFVAARLSGQRGLAYGAGCGLLLFFIVTLFGFGSESTVRGVSLLVKAALSVGFGALGGVLGVNVKQRKHR